MELPILVLTSMTLFSIVCSLILYLTTEKKKKAAREAELLELKELLSNVQLKIQDTSKETTERFEAIANRAAIKVDEIRTAFEDYSEKVKEALDKYANENKEFKKNTEQLKEQIQKELQAILNEIKNPLDLD